MKDEKNIILAMTGTVTITEDEYKVLLMSRVLLEAIFAHHKRDDTYRLGDMVTVAEEALSAVITGNRANPDSGSESGAEGNPNAQ